MSPATAETTEKLAQPLGSFITKLAPKSAEKAVEKSVEPPAKPQDIEAKKEAVPVGTTDTKPLTAKEPEGTPTELKTDDKLKDDKTEKRLKDAQTWGNEEHKARLDAERKAVLLEAQLSRIEAKLDGTYEEPKDPPPEKIAYDAEMRGKLRASHRAASKKYGEDHVMKTVWNPDSPYMKLQAANPHIGKRVLDADDPVQEAFDVLQEEEDATKYGRTSEEWKKNIEAELAPQLEKKILEGLKTRPGPATNTLGNVRGSTERTEQKSDAPTRLDLGNVFPWGASRR